MTLAHPAIFQAYPKKLTRYMSRLGAIRADARLALQAVQSGYSVQVYPGGDNDACRSFGRRNQIVFANRKGYVKLAKKAGVPIVPIVSIGAHEGLCVLWDGVPLAKFLGLDRRFGLKAFPLSLCLPWGIWLGPHPGYLPLPVKISLRVLDPIQPHGSVDDIDSHVRHVMQGALDQMAAARGFLGIKQRLEHIL
jgi:1-acyl-sn-glycerol-3-phosphate acyltransferase